MRPSSKVLASVSSNSMMMIFFLGGFHWSSDLSWLHDTPTQKTRSKIKYSKKIASTLMSRVILSMMICVLILCQRQDSNLHDLRCLSTRCLLIESSARRLFRKITFAYQGEDLTGLSVYQFRHADIRHPHSYSVMNTLFFLRSFFVLLANDFRAIGRPASRSSTK